MLAGSVGAAPDTVGFGSTPETADLAQIAAHTGTPAYVMFERTLRDNYTALRRALAVAEPVRLYYSVKSNFETGVLTTLREAGCGAEISGSVERLAVERAGFNWSEVIVDGPLKDGLDSPATLADRVRLINVESEPEIEALRRAAERVKRRVPIGVRVDPDVQGPSYRWVIRGYQHKFGFQFADLDALAERIAGAPELEWVGLMAHVGSQVMHAAPYLHTLERLFAAAAGLRRRGMPIEELNLGGGFPADSMLNLRVPRRVGLARLCERFGVLRARAESSLVMAARIAERVVALRRRYDLPVTIAFEPGRTLVASAGVMLGRVRVIKPPWVFVDISLNDLPEKLTLSEWRLVFPTRAGEPDSRRCHFSGPTLAAQDVLFFDHPAPELQCGDPIAILDAGAYSIARANQFTRPRAPVYFVDARGHLQLIRRAETPADVLATQVAATAE